MTLTDSCLFICSQVAHHQGYITINIGKMQRDTQRVQKMLKDKADRVVPALTDEVQKVRWPPTPPPAPLTSVCVLSCTQLCY